MAVQEVNGVDIDENDDETVAVENRDDELGQQESVEPSATSKISGRVSRPHDCAAKFLENAHLQNLMQAGRHIGPHYYDKENMTSTNDMISNCTHQLITI